MLSREQLEVLSLEDLHAIAKNYGIQPLGNYSKRENWMNAIARFPYKAICDFIFASLAASGIEFDSAKLKDRGGQV